MNRILYEDARHDLSALLSDALARNPYFSDRSVQVDVREQELVLTGSVGSYYLKQVAQESLRTLKEVPRIRNEIQVVDERR